MENKKSVNNTWDQKQIQSYIDDEIQESLYLEYKSVDSLSRKPKKKTEITKDVSAFANSAGGLIICGIKEFDEKEKHHLPEKITPIDGLTFSKEWLEQIINNIRPRIDGVVVYPVHIDSGENDFAYVVEIPQSTTAHQATDLKYYKRYNFQSVPMNDFEIRDVMGRTKNPVIQV